MNAPSQQPPSEADGLNIPLLLIVLGWVLVISVMATAVTIAVSHAPKTVPLEQPHGG